MILKTALGTIAIQALGADIIEARTVVGDEAQATGPLVLNKTAATVWVRLSAQEGWAPVSNADVRLAKTDGSPLGPVHRKQVIDAVRAAVLDLLETPAGTELLIAAELDQLLAAIAEAEGVLADPTGDHRQAQEQLTLATSQLAALA